MLNLLLIKLNLFLKWSFSAFCLFGTIIFFFISLVFFGLFDKNYSSYQFIYLKFFSGNINTNYCIGFGLDGLSLIFILLTTFLFVLVFLTC